MDLQKDFLNMQIAYEKNCAIRCNCSYEELKAQLDRSESLFGTRYLEGSPRHENWLLWVEAWQVAKSAPNWISVENQMPEQGQKVLVFRPHAHEKPHQDPNYKICTYAGEGIFINSHFEHEITHWMPLTNPLEQKS